MAVTPVLVEQIEKFHCLNLSTTQGLSAGTLRLHVATCHVPENVSQSFSTLTWNNSKNPTYLIWRSMRSSCIPSWPSENICHFIGQIFYIAWAPWGSVLDKTLLSFVDVANIAAAESDIAASSSGCYRCLFCGESFDNTEVLNEHVMKSCDNVN